MLASVAGMGSSRLRRTAAILQWMIYAGTHNAIAPSCGQRRLRSNFEDKHLKKVVKRGDGKASSSNGVNL